MIFHFLIPSLAMAEPADLADTAPSLRRFMMLGKERKTDRRVYEHRLGGLLGMPSDESGVSAAAICRSALGLSTEGRWICVSPVFLETGIEKIILHEFNANSLESSQAAALIDTFNRHFAEEGLRIEAGLDTLWFMRLPDHLDIHTQPLSYVRGGSIYPHLPGGDQAGFWHALMNELQMLFHDHPVNQDREQAGLRPVNGLWLWGEGVLPEPSQSGWDLVVTDDLIGRGLAGLGNIPCIAADQPVTDLEVGKRVLIIEPSLQYPAAMGDYDGWMKALIALEEVWFEPLCRDWNARRIQGLVIESDELVIDVGPRQRWRFWARC